MKSGEGVAERTAPASAEIATAGETGAPVEIEAPSAGAASDDPAGILYAALCYAAWGLLPLFWRLLESVPPLQIIAHRVFWCALFALGVSLARGGAARLAAIGRNRRLLATLALTGALIAANWLIYIWCVISNRLVEASLGYYIVPLVSIALGVTLLGERLSRLRRAAVALAALAVAVKMADLGHVPWVAPGLALSFGFYGYFRKQTPVGGMDGLTVETLVLFPLALAAIVFWSLSGASAFSTSRPGIDVLLFLAGPVTAIPLALFAVGARRIRLSTLGFLQYLSPSIMLVLAIFGFGERFTRIDAIGFGLAWAALVIAGVESRFARRAPAGKAR